MEKEGIRIRKERLKTGGIFLALFLLFFIFFRFVHPVVPWDGDDWSALGHFMSQSSRAIPGEEYPLFIGFSRFFPMLSGTFFGYLGAFVVYPLTGDYILSMTFITAVALAGAIVLSLYMLYKLLGDLSSGVWPLVGLCYFLVSAFLFLKNRPDSEYLYWQYNLYGAFWYCIPGYLSSAFGIYLIRRHLCGQTGFDLSLRTGMLVLALYFGIFSFMPAALFITMVSGLILLSTLIREKNLLSTLKKCWFYLLAIVLFLILLPDEFGYTFGFGYFSPVENSLGEKLAASCVACGQILSQIKKMFLLPAAAAVLGALGIFLYRKKKKSLTDRDRLFMGFFLFLTVLMLFMGLFFLMFGAVDIYHVMNEGLIRMDTLYLFFFLVLAIAAICLVYVLQNVKAAALVVPLALGIMLYTVVSPKNSFRDSFYTDTTPSQRYEIISDVVAVIQEKDAQGVEAFVVHMPPLHCYNGDPLINTLYFHNMIDHQHAVTFVYDSTGGQVWAE